ncbi:amino acid adenylation domain-containing protein, partial [Nocardia sp. NPDC050799]|uniref:non-ribosomal peptide synthetase n=1 Tax=Nocardia sp. NPDC050799 TaxID=3154842 RepID=UPI0033C03554
MSSSTHRSSHILTAAQRGMIYESLGADAGAATYHCQLVVTIAVPPDFTRFRETWTALTQAHPMLRNAFGWDGGHLRQRPGAGAHPQLINAGSVTDTPVDRLLADDRARPFSVDDGSELARAYMLADADRFHLILVNHHAILDGWSTTQLLDEFLHLYTSPEPVGAPEDHDGGALADYFDWLAAQPRDKAAAFWQAHLHGIADLAPLSRTLACGTLAEEPGWRHHRRVLDAAESDGLRRAARTLGSTLNSVIQATWATILVKNTGNTTALFAATSSGRTADTPGLDSAIGVFIQTYPIRIDPDPNDRFADLVKDVHGLAAERMDHEFVGIGEALRSAGIDNPDAVVDCALVFQNYPSTAPDELPAAEVTVSRVPTNYALTLVVEPDELMTLQFEYDPSRVADAAVQRVAEHFATALHRVVADPAIDVRTVQALPETEHELVTSAWNPIGIAVDDRTVVDRFRTQAATTPHACAVSTDDGASWTYAELDERSDLLAQYLRSRNIGTRSIVGICLDRGGDMVIALLAVLKAGAAYLPLDSVHPVDRLAFLLEDSAAALVVTRSGLLSRLPSPWNADAVAIDTDWPAIIGTDAGSEHAPPGPNPEDPAYVLYTSGSTGRPKGVVNQHRQLGHYLQWSAAQYLPDREHVVSRVTSSITFDLTVTTLWTPLTVGGRVHFVSEDDDHPLPNTQDLDRALVKTTPAHLRTLNINSDAASTSPFTGTIVVGGEALRREDVCRIRNVAGSARLINEYGPTEATVGCITHICDDNETDPVPIGRPIANTTAYVLDASMEPVGIGVAGELFLGGAGVAHGYIGRPELTAEKFVPDPFGTTPGARLYRTGDRARFLPDGMLEFLGRDDDQVKIRGYRVELGEVEAQLATMSGVSECAVTVHDDGHGAGRLVGYYAVDDRTDTTVDAGDIRAQLAARLPDYMVPSIFIELAAMPLTTNGKLDRTALPAPEGRTHVGVDYVAPTTEPEKLLARIWGQVLTIDGIGVHDNFFELGGDSILSLLAVGKARQEGLAITPQLILQFPTISRLTEHLVDNQQSTTGGDPDVANDSESGYVPLSPIQHWFLSSTIDNPHHFNHSILLRARQPLDRAALTVALTAVL